MKNNPRNDYIPNQGCGIFFLMVLSVFLLLSIPVLKFSYELFFEKHVLLTSDSPNKIHHVEISTKGRSTKIFIEEETTSSELDADIITNQLTYITSENIKVQWLNETVAEIIVTGRRDSQNYFLFDADAEDEKIEKAQNYE